MSDKIDAFLTEVRNMPKFVAASATNPKWLEHFEAMKNTLAIIDRQADYDPRTVDALDEIESAVGRTGLPVKQRLLEVSKIVTRWRNVKWPVN
jgi:hypothetical protein